MLIACRLMLLINVIDFLKLLSVEQLSDSEKTLWMFLGVHLCQTDDRL